VKKHHYKFSFSLTALLYGLLFLLYLYTFRTVFTVSDTPPKERAIVMALSRFVPQAEPLSTDLPSQPDKSAEEPISPEEPSSEELMKEKLSQEVPPKEKTPPPEPEKTLPKPTPIVKKTPAATPVSKPKKVHRKVVKKHRKRAKTHPKHRVVKKRSGGGSPRYSAAQRNRFLAMIRKRIERAKSYPRIARRRGMQGTVHVRFTILSNGHVSGITLSGPKVFHTSARKAVQSAFPVDVKHATITLPEAVNLSLCYKLR